MEDNSFDPRTWLDGAPRHDDEPAGGAVDQSGATRPDFAFPLASAAALRLWLGAAVVLAVAAAGAWAMRAQPDAAWRFGAGQATAPADHAQAPAP